MKNLQSRVQSGFLPDFAHIQVYKLSAAAARSNEGVQLLNYVPSSFLQKMKHMLLSADCVETTSSYR